MRSPIFSYIRRLGPFFGVRNFEFHFFFFGGGGGGVQKMNIFWVWRFCGNFLGSSQNWTIFKGHFYAFS